LGGKLIRKNFMARKPIATSLPDTFLGTLQKGKSVHEFRNKQRIFSQGDAADSVFYLQKGKVKMAVVSKRGKEAVIGMVEPGQFFGESSLVAGHPLRMASATSIGHSIILRFEKPAVVRLLHEDTEFADCFVSYMLARTVRVEEDLVDQLFNSTEKRLARVLLLLANFGQDGKPQTVIPRISQETLAQMVGASRPRVSSFLNKFRKLGFIEYNGGLKVNSSLLRMALRDSVEPGRRTASPLLYFPRLFHTEQFLIAAMPAYKRGHLSKVLHDFMRTRESGLGFVAQLTL
jgi:CRP/FNR family cyclic AMP-dependent transcriptional regulator